MKRDLGYDLSVYEKLISRWVINIPIDEINVPDEVKEEIIHLRQKHDELSIQAWEALKQIKVIDRIVVVPNDIAQLTKNLFGEMAEVRSTIEQLILN